MKPRSTVNRKPARDRRGAGAAAFVATTRPATANKPLAPHQVSVEPTTGADMVNIVARAQADPAAVNRAWRRFKSAAPAEAEHLRDFFPRLQARLPDAAIELPAEYLAPSE
ncbi:hypothetical protein HKX42_00015 [Salinisphaera sp. USBA-960]|nr:hypothetical protein [Salifodinibacter halophilus]NNC25276.1 hypothetical protein [Salifodinibacter halophilus]